MFLSCSLTVIRAGGESDEWSVAARNEIVLSPRPVASKPYLSCVEVPGNARPDYWGLAIPHYNTSDEGECGPCTVRLVQPTALRVERGQGESFAGLVLRH